MSEPQSSLSNIAAKAAHYIDRLGRGAYGRVYGIRTRIKCPRSSWFHTERLQLRGNMPSEDDISEYGGHLVEEEVLAYLIMIIVLRRNRRLDPARIAIKFLDADGGSAVEEASIMSRFASPHVVRVLGFGQDQRWFLMERAGFNMERLRLNNRIDPRRARVLNASPLPRKFVLDLMLQLLAIAFMISVERIDHRDIAPKNVLVVPYDVDLLPHQTGSVNSLIQACIRRRCSTRPLSVDDHVFSGDYLHERIAELNNVAKSVEIAITESDEGKIHGDELLERGKNVVETSTSNWPESISQERKYVEDHLRPLPALLLKVTDFGAARSLDLGLSGHPSAGPGTPYYLVPFKCSGNKISKLPGLFKQLLFNVCVLIHELFYGIYPFDQNEPRTMEALAAASQSYMIPESKLEERRRRLFEASSNSNESLGLFRGLCVEMECHLPSDFAFFSMVLDARKWNQWDLSWILQSHFVANYLPTSLYQFVIWQHLLRASHLLPNWSQDQCKHAALEMNRDLFLVLSQHSPCKFCDLPESESKFKDLQTIVELPSSLIYETEDSQARNESINKAETSLTASIPEQSGRREWTERAIQYSRVHELKSIEKSKLSARSHR